MKKVITLLTIPLMMLCMTLLAQQPPAGGGPAGGQGGRGGGAGGRGGAPAAPATGPLADATNKIVDAINKQDAAYFDKALTADSLLLDEDGHMVPARAWVAKLTGASKKLSITGLRISEFGTDAGYGVFAYTLDETAQGAPNQIKGQSSIVYKKNGADWQAVLIQLSVNGKAVQPH